MPSLHENRRPFQFRLRTLLLAVAVAGGISGAFVYLRTILPQSQEARRLVDRSTWPRPLKELLIDLAGEGMRVEPVEVFHSPSWQFSYVWRMNGGRYLAALAAQKWRLGPASAADIERLSHDMPPEWQATPGGRPFSYLSSGPAQADKIIVRVDYDAGLVYFWSSSE